MQYDSNIAGKIYRNTNIPMIYDYFPGESYYKFRGSAGELDGSYDIGYVQLTGVTEVNPVSGYTMYQTTTGYWITFNGDTNWEYVEYKPIKQYSDSDAQKYINQIIECNKQIIQNNLFCARFAKYLTNAEKRELWGLQSRLQTRNQALTSQSLIKSYEEASPAGYNQFGRYLEDFMADDSYYNDESTGIGVVISTTAIIIISALVVGSLATAAYFAYKAMAAEAKQDVKFSDKLTKTLLEKLTPEEYEQLKQETQGMVTKASIVSRLSGSLGAIKWVLLAGALAYVGFAFLTNRKETKK